jgi:hypothetical protein
MAEHSVPCPTLWNDPPMRATRLTLKYPIRGQLRADDGSVKSVAAKHLAMEMIIFLRAEKIK